MRIITYASLSSVVVMACSEPMMLSKVESSIPGVAIVFSFIIEYLQITQIIQITFGKWSKYSEIIQITLRLQR